MLKGLCELINYHYLHATWPYDCSFDNKSRDRNREHAKNTRLRKKAYVVKLKELVDQMNGQKDMEEKERRALGERVHDTVSRPHL